MADDCAVRGDGSRPKMVTGQAVLIAFVTFFAIVAGANGVLIRAALSTFGGLETASSYQAGLSFAHEAAMAKAQEAQHWQVDGKVTSAPDGTTRIDILARDAGGRPLTGLQVTAMLAHPADRRLDRIVVMTMDSAGHFSGRTGPAAGQWDVVIDLARNGERLFRSRNRVILR